MRERKREGWTELVRLYIYACVHVSVLVRVCVLLCVCVRGMDVCCGCVCGGVL